MCNFKKFCFIAVFIIITPFLFFTLVNAELLTNPAFIYDAGDSGVELFLGKSLTKCNGSVIGEIDDIRLDLEYENSSFSGSYAYGFGRHLNVYASVALIFDSSAELYTVNSDGKIDGDGRAFGLGVKGEYEKFNINDAVFTYYMQILKSDIDWDDDAGSMDLFEITTGALLKKEIHKDIIGYAGLEYVLNSDRKENVDAGKINLDRKDRMGAKLGLIIPIGQANVFVDAGLMNELSLKVGINFPFGGSRAIAKTSSFSDQNLDEAIEAQQVTTPKSNMNISDSSNQNSSEIMEERPVAISRPNMNVPDNLDQNTNRIKESQQKLFELGYDPGPIDGIAGDRYQKTLRLYQKNSGLQATGGLNEATIKSLDL